MRLSVISLASVVLLLASCELLFAEEPACSEENGVCTNPDQVPSAASKVRVAKGSNVRGEPPKADMADCHDRYPQCVGYEQQGEDQLPLIS